ncbi:MAG: MauE/DoxX family redox-associated membrane protein [Thermodesulfobacteriota bacterium]
MGRLIQIVARTALAVAFLWAGAVKLARPEVFAVTIDAFGILPDGLVAPLSVILPAAEIVAAVLLLFEMRGGLALSAGLLAVFIGVLAYALRMGLDIDCGCYGPSEPEREAFGSIRQALWRDLAMLCGVAFLYWRKGRGERPERGAPTGAR